MGLITVYYEGSQWYSVKVQETRKVNTCLVLSENLVRIVGSTTWATSLPFVASFASRNLHGSGDPDLFARQLARIDEADLLTKTPGDPVLRSWI